MIGDDITWFGRKVWHPEVCRLLDGVLQNDGDAGSDTVLWQRAAQFDLVVTARVVRSGGRLKINDLQQEMTGQEPLVFEHDVVPATHELISLAGTGPPDLLMRVLI